MKYLRNEKLFLFLKTGNQTSTIKDNFIRLHLKSIAMKLSKFIILILFTSLCFSKANAQKKEAIKITYKAINNLDLIATSTDELFILNDHTKVII